MTREEAIDYNKNLRMHMRLSDKNQPYKFPEKNYIALDMAIEALEQEPCNTDTCKVVKAYMNEWDKPNNKDIIQLPPVNPQEPKTGHWIDGKCNRCGTHAPYWAMATTYYCSEYCPNCGAKMIEPQEGEDTDANDKIIHSMG